MLTHLSGYRDAVTMCPRAECILVTSVLNRARGRESESTAELSHFSRRIRNG